MCTYPGFLQSFALHLLLAHYHHCSDAHPPMPAGRCGARAGSVRAHAWDSELAIFGISTMHWMCCCVLGPCSLPAVQKIPETNNIVPTQSTCVHPGRHRKQLHGTSRYALHSSSRRALWQDALQPPMLDGTRRSQTGVGI